MVEMEEIGGAMTTTIKKKTGKKEKPFKVGYCFKCGADLEDCEPRGFTGHDGIPVYVDCRRCKAVNNYYQRYIAWQKKVIVRQMNKE